jgi:hypothetical protein
MIRTTAGTRFGAKISLGTVLVIFLAYFFAASPAYGIERFTDAKGVIHISNLPNSKGVKPTKLETPAQAPIPSPIQTGEPPVLPPEPVADVRGPHIDPVVPTPKNISEIASTPSSAPSASPSPAIATDEASQKAQINSAKGQKEEEAIAGAHQGEGDGPRTIPESMAPRGTQVLEINTPQTEEEANPDIIFATAANNNIGCYRDSWGVLHITNVSTPEPIDLAELGPGSRTPRKAPKAWAQESAEDLLVAINLESREGQSERTLGVDPTQSNQARGEIPKCLRVYQDYRGIIHIQDLDQEEHLPHTVST